MMTMAMMPLDATAVALCGESPYPDPEAPHYGRSDMQQLHGGASKLSSGIPPFDLSAERHLPPFFEMNDEIQPCNMHAPSPKGQCSSQGTRYLPDPRERVSLGI